jgi:hypothetical protein
MNLGEVPGVSVKAHQLAPVLAYEITYKRDSIQEA